MCAQARISEEEAAFYDRQIRLWGLEAQSRLKRSKLLLIGLSPIAGEIVKNIVLCGINTLVVCDNQVVRQSDVDQCYLFEKSCIGQMRNASIMKRARSFNEMVYIKCDDSISADLLARQYQECDEVIVALDSCEGIFGKWIDCTKRFCAGQNRPKIHCVTSFGMHAVGFIDLGCYTYDSDDCIQSFSYKYTPSDSLKNSPNGGKLWSTVQYPSLKAFFDMSWCSNVTPPIAAKRMPKGFFLAHLVSWLDCPISYRNLKETWPRVAENLGVPLTLLSDDDFESCCGPTPVAVNPIIGGIISQEIIQSLSHKGKPKGNWLFLDGRSCEATVLWLPKHP